MGLADVHGQRHARDRDRRVREIRAPGEHDGLDPTGGARPARALVSRRHHRLAISRGAAAAARRPRVEAAGAAPVSGATLPPSPPLLTHWISPLSAAGP